MNNAQRVGKAKSGGDTREKKRQYDDRGGSWRGYWHCGWRNRHNAGN